MEEDSRGGPGAEVPPPGPLRIARAVLALPGLVLCVVPGTIVALAPGPPLRPAPWPLVAAAPAALGLALMAWTITLFACRGRGTLAPWDAPPRLVVEGPYRHVRNPMIVGVLLVLAGEATALRAPVWAWLLVFLLVNLGYVALVEERRLLRRFGAEYERYRRAVPAWIPRLRPWREPWRDAP